MRWLETAVGATIVAIVATAILFEPVPTLIVPALAALAPVILRRSSVARQACICSAVLLGAFALLGLWTAGALFLPATIAMAVSASRMEPAGASPTQRTG